MSDAQKQQTVQNTVQTQMEKNQQVMQQQGITNETQYPPGTTPPVGFQPPESMKKYMNKGAAGPGATPGGGAPAGQATDK
jgi:hypothetical protein